ncbi:MAG: spore germination protein, partial [Firmicutes bacterium]|nr:spore germination protein [Bacillota bacterium]
SCGKSAAGSQEGFTEVLLFNVSLVRRKLCNPDLRFEFRRIGKQSQTMVAVGYMDGIADSAILEEVNRRLDKIQIDGILDANYVEELIKDDPWSPFKTIGSTERPDIVTAKLLEGHAAIFIDGTPVVLTAPYFFLEYFQTNDDYYTNFYAATFNRWLRTLGFWATISLPAIFLGLFTFHQELLPTRFLMNLSAAREQLPFPTLMEMLLLIFGFELIREGGAKAPANFGQTLGIVGGLVLGQAAVDAKLVSIPVVIIIAFTGITGLMIPQLKSPVILFRLAFLFLASLWGLPGYLAGLFCLLLHLSSLKSFTIPYTSALSNSPQTMLQDTFLRAPWFRMIYRPDALAKNNHRRQLRCILLLLLPLLLTGCTSSREINDVALISGITVEVAGNQWYVHAQIPEISKDEEDLRLISGQGPTFEKAMENLHELANEELYLHHSKSVALTGDFTRTHLSQIVNYILDHRELRIASDVVVFHNTAPLSLDHMKLQKMLLSKPKIYQLNQQLASGADPIHLPLLSVSEDGSFLVEGTYSVKGNSEHGF